VFTPEPIWSGHASRPGGDFTSKENNKMTHLTNILKTGGRAAIIALTLGASTIAVVPAAQAQSFNFQFGVDGSGKPSVGFGVDSDGYGRPGRPIRPQVCYSDREIIRGIRNEGYRDVQIVRELPRNRLGIIARDGRTWYSMRVNQCTGEVDRIERLRRYRPGVQFEFNF
jgi:hypothetical protein